MLRHGGPGDRFLSGSGPPWRKDHQGRAGQRQGLTWSHRAGHCWTTGWTQRHSGAGGELSSPGHYPAPAPAPAHSGHPQSHWSDLQHTVQQLSWRALPGGTQSEGPAEAWQDSTEPAPPQASRDAPSWPDPSGPPQPPQAHVEEEPPQDSCGAPRKSVSGSKPDALEGATLAALPVSPGLGANGRVVPSPRA